MRVLMVCLGNICRSPMAQGVLEAAARAAGLAVSVDSAGLSDWHVGDPPDRRAIAAAAARGFDIAGQRARVVTDEDFGRFDLICAMDSDVLDALREMAPDDATARLALLLDFAPQSVLRSIPDPYTEDAAAFESVLDLIETGVAGLCAALRAASDRA